VKENVYTSSFLLFSVVLLLLSLLVQASHAKDYTGWEIDSPYNKIYNPKEIGSIKGKVVKFVDVTPLPGMASGTGMIVVEGKDDKTLVHICPESYASARETGIRIGEKVKVKGSWVEIGDDIVFIASKIKQGDNFVFKVRKTSDGTPFWTMSKEELAYEKSQVE